MNRLIAKENIPAGSIISTKNSITTYTVKRKDRDLSYINFAKLKNKTFTARKFVICIIEVETSRNNYSCFSPLEKEFLSSNIPLFSDLKIRAVTFVNGRQVNIPDISIHVANSEVSWKELKRYISKSVVEISNYWFPKMEGKC